MEISKIDQENSSTSSGGPDTAEAQRFEIEQLKRDLAYHRSMLAALKEQNSHKGTANLFHSFEFENLNSNVDLRADLHRFAGMHCVKLDKACVFQFLTGHKVTKNDIYAVEILQTDGHQRLGRWVMPMSIDLHDLVLDYPLENPKNIKPFLKCCKHHIDCYFSRREQYYQLKDFLADARNCFLDTTLGYLQVHLHMSGIKMIDSERIYNISLYMGYESDRAFPTKMAMELREGKMLPPEVAPHFFKYFKHFKRYRLREAFEKVISNSSFFQWLKVSYDYDEFAVLTDGQQDKREHDGEESDESDKDEQGEEELDELDKTETSRKSQRRKGKGRSNKKDVKKDLNHDLNGLEEKSGGEKSLSSEEKEDRPKAGRKVNEARARKTPNAEKRRKSTRILNSKAKNVNIEKYLTSKVKSTTEGSSNGAEEGVTMEKLKENSKEGENSKECDNSKELENSKKVEDSREIENSMEKKNSRVKKDDQIDRTNNMINPSGDVINDNVEISNDASDRTGDEVEKNVSSKKTTPLSKSTEQIQNKLPGKSKKGRGVKKSLNRKSNVSDLSTKSATNMNVGRNENELTMVPTNVSRSNIISSTPISKTIEAKLYSSQCTDISEIALAVNAKSKKDHATVEQDIPKEKISEEDSSISDDMNEENAYEEAKELLKDIENVLKKEEAMKSNIQKNVKKMRKRKKGKVV